MALVVAGAVTVAVTRDDPGRAGRPATATTTTTTPAPPVWEPVWTAPVTCVDGPPSGEVTTRCGVAVDDERAYVLDQRDDGSAGVPTLVARAVADGRPVWEVPVPGALTVDRLPTALVVRAGRRTQAVDPATGALLWTMPGLLVAPLGRDHLLVDDASDAPDGLDLTRVSVVETATGAVTWSAADAAADLTVHPCGEAGLALVSQDGRLTAHEVGDGSVRWSVPSARHDAGDPLVCGAAVVVGLQGGGLAARDTRTGEVVGSVALDPPADDRSARVLGVVGDTVVVELADGVQGVVADPSLARRWLTSRPDRPIDVVLGPAAGGVAFAVVDDRAGWYGPDGAGGAQVPLPVGASVVIQGERLVAWRGDEVLVAPAADVTRARRLTLAGVQRVAVGPGVVAVLVDGAVGLHRDP